MLGTGPLGDSAAVLEGGALSEPYANIRCRIRVQADLRGRR